MRTRPPPAGRFDRVLEISLRRYEGGHRQRPHSHDYDGVTLVLRGSLEETVAGRVEPASALSVVFKPAGVVHGLFVGDEGVSTLQLRLVPGTLALALPALVRSDRLSVHPAGWRWTHAGPAVSEILRGSTVPDAPLRARGFFAAERRRVAVARLLRVFSEECRGYGVANQGEGAPVWLARVHESIAGPGPAARLAIAARAARVHPVYLARMFRRYYGCSIGELAKRTRLRLTARLLGEPLLPLADVAGEAGYSDQAHLCREFRGATGVTPLQYRRVALDA